MDAESTDLKNEHRQLVHLWLLENGPVLMRDAHAQISEGTGLPDSAARLAVMRLISCGAIALHERSVYAREEVDPLSREDHLDCWPVCDCFEDGDRIRFAR